LPITAANGQWLAEAIDDSALLVDEDSHLDLLPI